MNETTISDEHAYLLSYYRTSEISGALFFGRLAKLLRPGPVQMDMTKHFADEAMHAHRWTDALRRLGREPLKLKDAYQDQYAEAIGVPANVMEVLAVTQVFEKRVIGAYARHARLPELHPIVREPLDAISEDERWHIAWIREALERLEPEYGKDHIEATLRRYREADREVYAKTMQEHEERVNALFGEGDAPWRYR